MPVGVSRDWCRRIPFAKGLFHRAISQSGGFSPALVASGQNFADEGGHHTSARELTNKLLIADGLVEDAAGARGFQEDWSSTQIRDYLYGKSPEDIYAMK